jgi:hypothetical protein
MEDKIIGCMANVLIAIVILFILALLGIGILGIAAPEQTAPDNSTTQPYVVPVPVPYIIPSTSHSPYSPHEEPIIPHIEEPIVPHVVVP